jgi:flagellar biosynthesis/type III secretory pathway protein FliH
MFREDESIIPGGCIVETEVGTIDAQIDTQLKAIKKALNI